MNLTRLAETGGRRDVKNEINGRVEYSLDLLDAAVAVAHGQQIVLINLLIDFAGQNVGDIGAVNKALLE